MEYTVCQKYGLPHPRLHTFIASPMRVCKMKMRPKKSWLFFTIVILIVIAVLAVAMLSFPMHPSPEYSVNTYEDLSEEIKGLCSLPSKEVLPNIEVKYTVYLESRFSNKKAGYIMSFNSTETGTEELTISCKSIDVLQNESLQMTPTLSYNEVKLFEDRNHIYFILDGFRYDIHGSVVTDTFAQDATLIVKSIIDAQVKAY